MNPDLFITIVFVSLVIVVALAGSGAVVVRELGRGRDRETRVSRRGFRSTDVSAQRRGQASLLTEPSRARARRETSRKTTVGRRAEQTIRDAPDRTREKQ